MMKGNSVRQRKKYFPPHRNTKQVVEYYPSNSDAREIPSRWPGVYSRDWLRPQESFSGFRIYWNPLFSKIKVKKRGGTNQLFPTQRNTKEASVVSNLPWLKKAFQTSLTINPSNNAPPIFPLSAASAEGCRVRKHTREGSDR